MSEYILIPLLAVIVEVLFVGNANGYIIVYTTLGFLLGLATTLCGLWLYLLWDTWRDSHA